MSWRSSSTTVLALQQAGADRREALIRAGSLGGMEQAILSLGGCAAAIAVLALALAAPPSAGTLPLAIIPVPATFAAFWAAGRFAPRLRGRPGWRGRVSLLLYTVLLTRELFAHPRRHAMALGGMAMFWTAEIFAVFAGLEAFGLTMNLAALIVGFC